MVWHLARRLGWPNNLFDKAEKVFATAMESFVTEDETLAREVLVLEDEIDEIEEKNERNIWID